MLQLLSPPHHYHCIVNPHQPPPPSITLPLITNTATPHHYHHISHKTQPLPHPHSSNPPPLVKKKKKKPPPQLNYLKPQPISHYHAISTINNTNTTHTQINSTKKMSKTTYSQNPSLKTN